MLRLDEIPDWGILFQFSYLRKCSKFPFLKELIRFCDPQKLIFGIDFYLFISLTREETLLFSLTVFPMVNGLPSKSGVLNKYYVNGCLSM